MITFIPNRSFFSDLLGDEDYIDGLKEKAEEAKGHAEAVAPRGAGPYPPQHPGEPGDYARSFAVTEIEGRVYLGNFDYKAIWLEFGTVDTPTFACLRAGVTAAGMKVAQTKT